MKHMTEEELVAYRDGETKGREASTAHLRECAECRAQLERFENVFAALDAVPVPDPGENYGQQVWQQIAPRLPQKTPSWWRRAAQMFTAGGWFAPGRLAEKEQEEGGRGRYYLENRLEWLVCLRVWAI